VLTVAEANKLTDETRAEMGIMKKLPRTLGQALGFLEEDGMLKEALGERFVQAYLSVKKVSDRGLC
jgi:glutamine synthetase